MMNDKIKEGMQLGKIKSVAWHLEGENPSFGAERVKVRMEDTDGKLFELVIHSEPWCENMRNEEEVILNFLFAYHGIMPKGEWIGFTGDLSEIVNKCRHQFKYTDVFFVNEDRCSWNGFETPEYIV